jgi:nicotinamide-nucleotide adenylyltransferase
VTRALYLGRFQPFHSGHHRVIEYIADTADEFVIGIGSAGCSHTVSNPFTAGERITMITRALQESTLVTYPVPIEDIDRHAVWVSHILSMCPQFDVVYSNNPTVVRLFTERGLSVCEPPLYDRRRFTGTRIRRRIIDGEPWRSLLPASVVEVIETIDGIERLRQLSRDDTGTADSSSSADSWLSLPWANRNFPRSR